MKNNSFQLSLKKNQKSNKNRYFRYFQEIFIKYKFINKDVEQTINSSINKFKFIDYFLLHSFSDYNSQVINKLVEFKQNKLIGKIGVSVYTVEEAIECLKNENIDVKAIKWPARSLLH